MKKILFICIFCLLIGSLNSAVVDEKSYLQVNERLEFLTLLYDLPIGYFETEIAFQESLGENSDETQKAIMSCLKNLCTEIPQTENQEEVEKYLSPKIEKIQELKKRIEWNSENYLYLGEEKRKVLLNKIDGFEQELENGVLEYKNKNFYLEIKGKEIGFGKRFFTKENKIFFPFGSSNNQVFLEIPEELPWEISETQRIEVNEKGAFLLFEAQRKILVFFFFKIDSPITYSLNLSTGNWTEKRHFFWANFGPVIE